MGTIKTVLECNHTHTDIGFTDYQDVCFRQHAGFIDRALDLIEATDGYPEEARYKWTCETTGLSGARRQPPDPRNHGLQATAAAKRSDPIESADGELPLDGGRLAVNLEPLAISTVLVSFKD